MSFAAAGDAVSLPSAVGVSGGSLDAGLSCDDVPSELLGEDGEEPGAGLSLAGGISAGVVVEFA